MEIDKTLKLDADAPAVWAMLLDPVAMGACVPGMQSIDVISPDEYAAQMQVKISFISARFKLRTRIVERREPHYLRAEGTGEDASVASSLKQTTEMYLDARADGGTDLRLKVKVDLLGRMGTFGLSVMKTKADRLWDEFGVNLAARLAQGTTSPAPVAAAATTATTGLDTAAAAPAAPTAPEPASRASASAGMSAAAGATAAASATLPIPAKSPPMAAAATAAGGWARVLRALGIAPLAAPPSGEVIVVEIRRPDQTLVRVEWPASLAAECRQWLQDNARA